MCGIAGFQGHFDAQLLARMSERIAHRGPDDQGALVLPLLPRSGAQLGLAHRRLSIIDLSPDGHQPMGVRCQACEAEAADDSERMWLVYNGELYNYRQLRGDLETKGHRFFSQSDTEVLLHLYAERGPAMLRELDGIFAFALFDGRPRGQLDGMRSGDLLVARDGLGVKPLYTCQSPQGLLFASELKALLAWDGLDRRLDPDAIHHYLTYLWAPAPETPLAGVRKLEPGQAMLVRDGRVERSFNYYDLPYGRPPRGESREQIGTSVRNLLEAAVDRQLVADVPVGAFLSGGLDSSAIVAAMRRLRPSEPIRCYTIGFEGGGGVDGHSEDLPYARRVARHLNVDLQVVQVGPSMIEALGTLLYHLDEPQGDPAPLNAMLIAQQARRDGITVLMSGAGGDDIFSGYRRHLALRLERYWRRLPLLARSLAALPARAALAGRSPVPGMSGRLARSLARVAAYADLPDDDRLIAYFYWSGESLRRGLYAPEFARGLSGVDAATPLRDSLARIPTERDPLNRMLYLEARHFLADHNLNYTDKTSMAAGVEVRVPLLDPALIDYATRIPSSEKLRRGTAKAAFKTAMEPWLPHDVIYRPKTGFGVPLRRWLSHELRPLADELLSPASLRKRGVFDPPAVERLVKLDRAGRIDGAYTIFAVLCIELWCRIFLDGGGQAPRA